jgi:photosystem II stability/assembly factor-like uncharacterized protein
MELWAATHEGVIRMADAGHGWQEQARGLEGQHVTSIIAREGVVLAGTTAGIQRSEDGGQSWQEASTGLTQLHVRWLAYHPQVSDLELAGTEPAAIFVSHDGANTWDEKPAVAALRDQYDWMLPYSPNDGCIRGFAVHGERIYAAAEDGALLRSDDRGESWRLAPGSPGARTHNPPSGAIHSDVHSVTVHKSDPDLVLAPTGGGLFRSEDGGASWENVYRCYCRAAWWDPARPEHVVFGPADGVDRLGRFAESWDGGATWQESPERPWPRHMIERLLPAGDRLFAILSDGSWQQRPLGGSEWEPLPQIGWVTALTAMG